MSPKMVAPRSHFRTIVYQNDGANQSTVVATYDFLVRHQAICCAMRHNRKRVASPVVFARVYNDIGEEIHNELTPVEDHPMSCL
jgi:hypothetical protein